MSHVWCTCLPLFKGPKVMGQCNPHKLYFYFAILGSKFFAANFKPEPRTKTSPPACCSSKLFQKTSITYCCGLSRSEQSVSRCSLKPHLTWWSDAAGESHSPGRRTSGWEWKASAAPRTPPSSCPQSSGRLAPGRKREACTPPRCLRARV